MSDQHVADGVRQRNAGDQQHNYADQNFIDRKHREKASAEADHRADKKRSQELKNGGVAEYGKDLLLQKPDERARQRSEDAIPKPAAEKDREAARAEHTPEKQQQRPCVSGMDGLHARVQLLRRKRLLTAAAAERVQRLELLKIDRG